ncbi:MAG: hypothetical protein DRP78_03155 [Candidatus Omnitrophota bacterium]|nr:MAG: hypothetical protein DRP78_03155 [Candidatus Omnitrophota bacterium]
MKKTICFVLILCFCLFPFILKNCFAQAEQQSKDKEQISELYVYSDQDDPKNHYYPSEKIGDNADLEITEGCKDAPQVGNDCIKVTYKAKGDYGWAGVYWVNPSGNWGNKKGGYDLRFAKKLSFWVKGEKGNELIAVFRFGGVKGTFSDSDIHGIGPIVLTNQWKQYVIDVSKRNMRYISAGFGFALTKAHNLEGCIFYIDDVKYE